MGFLDVAGLARGLGDYPADEVLASVGAGIRWRTPVGPVRLEYGHNLNRRNGDPVGHGAFFGGVPVLNSGRDPSACASGARGVGTPGKPLLPPNTLSLA